MSGQWRNIKVMQTCKEQQVSVTWKEIMLIFKKKNYLRAFIFDVIFKKIIPTIKHSDLIRTWYHYNCHSFPQLSKSLIHGWGEAKCAGLSRNFTFPATRLSWSTTRKWILNDWRLSEPRDELDMQENTDRAGVCRSSEVTAQVIKDAAMYAIFPRLVTAECGSLGSFMI